jgi:hypothetical protein
LAHSQALQLDIFARRAAIAHDETKSICDMIRAYQQADQFAPKTNLARLLPAAPMASTSPLRARRDRA